MWIKGRKWRIITDTQSFILGCSEINKDDIKIALSNMRTDYVIKYIKAGKGYQGKNLKKNIT